MADLNVIANDSPLNDRGKHVDFDYIRANNNYKSREKIVINMNEPSRSNDTESNHKREEFEINTPPLHIPSEPKQPQHQPRQYIFLYFVCHTQRLCDRKPHCTWHKTPADVLE